MRLAHTAIVTPHRAGLYESVRDIVAAERELGEDAYIVDPTAKTEDRGAPIGRGDGLDQADVVFNHSGLGDRETGDTPIVHCMHGRPESSFRLELKGVTPVYSYLARTRDMVNVKLWVTFWPQFVDYWSLVVPREQLRLVTPPVDLAAWTPDGPDGYAFGGHRDDINVVCTDLWREDKTPFHAIHAFAKFAETYPNARLHLYGVQKSAALTVILTALKQREQLGEVAGYVTGLANVYRAATMLISTHSIATRSIREASACGCPVVAPYTVGCAQDNIAGLAGFMGDTLKDSGRVAADGTLAERSAARSGAEANFDSGTTASQMLAIAQEAAQCQS